MPLLAVVAIALVSLAIVAVNASRASLVARLRAGWGQPIARDRKLDAIETSNRDRRAEFDGRDDALDDRTWADLNMDAVFEALDRTTSTAGQHALYHRLRYAPAAPDLAAFDALVERFRSEP